ncbi:hypothetical protein K9L63_00835 [Candidatus Gracilibacteria bacterium]|nr:hypothetical protein [Candidatus Gracilibacteria bacterium]
MNVAHYSTTENIEKPGIARAEVNYSFVWILRGSFCVALILGFLYLMFLNTLATQGFALEELKTERMRIQKEVEKWDIAIAIPTSLYALQSSEQVQEMEDVANEREFAFVKQGQVAMSQ